MKEESKLYFWDAAGKFDAVKEEAHRVCQDEFDLTIYSLTQAGAKVPTALIVKMTPIGQPEGYLAGQAGVLMFYLNYQTFPVEGLTRIVNYMNSILSLKLYSDPCYVQFGQGNDLFRGFGRGNDLYMVKPISIEDFFGLDPREDERGAQMYLRDKAFFVPMAANPEKPDFAALPLLTKDQKAKVAEIDMSSARLSGGRRVLSRLFKGYRSLCRLDVSALNTTGATEMEEMFSGCQSLQRLDLSAFDFSQVKHLKNMFSGCTNLEEVLLSDTILRAGGFPHNTGRKVQVLRHNYFLSGPHAGEHDLQTESEICHVPFSEAEEEEVYKHLGLQYGQQKITIVPHRAHR